MKKNFVTFSIMFALMGLMVVAGGCSKHNSVSGNEQYNGSGRLASLTPNVGSFSGIDVADFAKVYIKQDTVESLRIEIDDNLTDRVMATVNNGTLSVGLKQGSYHNVTVNVYATMKTVSHLTSVGAADFSSLNQLNTDSIVLKIFGAGTITLAGTAKNQTVEITGAGSVHNFDLTSATCSASISGTGSIDVTATEQLDAVITGVGTITYDGHPKIVHPTVTGVGSIRAR
jgi:hypothetical protein